LSISTQKISPFLVTIRFVVILILYLLIIPRIMGSVLVTLGRYLYRLSSVSVWPYIPQENCLTMAKIQTYSDKTKLITKNDQ